MPDVLCGVCAVAKSEPGTSELATEVSKGRQLEREDIVARESFTQRVRDDELAAGRASRLLRLRCGAASSVTNGKIPIVGNIVRSCCMPGPSQTTRRRAFVASPRISALRSECDSR